MKSWTDWRGYVPKNMTGIEITIIVTIAVFVGVIILAANVENKAHQRFMADCMTDHKEYECTLMWKESKPDVQTVVVPVYTQ